MKLLFLFLLSFQLQASEQEALKTIKALGKNLKKELKAAMKTSPIHALSVCNTKAMKISETASQRGIKVGRVSLKNRNPQNTPKDWMKPFIENYHAKKEKRPYVVVKISKDKSGILKPIKTDGLCLKCHGTNIAPELSAKISELYPNDKATGYRAGEIRGFFWAEY